VYADRRFTTPHFENFPNLPVGKLSDICLQVLEESGHFRDAVNNQGKEKSISCWVVIAYMNGMIFLPLFKGGMRA